MRFFSFYGYCEWEQMCGAGWKGEGEREHERLNRRWFRKQKDSKLFLGVQWFFMDILLLLLLLLFNMSHDHPVISFSGQLQKCRHCPLIRMHHQLLGQYSHLNSNGLPLRSVSSLSFRLIKYDINAHELIKTLNGAYLKISRAMLVHFKRTQKHAFQFLFNN